LSIVQEAEASQRGYVITGLDEYLEPHDAAMQRLGGVILALPTLYADRPETRLQLAHILELAERKVERMAHTISVRRSRGFEAARQVVLDHMGKNLMDELRQEIAFQTSIERRRIATVEQVYSAAQARGWAVFADLSAVVLLGIAVLLAIAAREMRASHQANTKLAYLAGHDPLTGLANRRSFHEALDQMLSASTASRKCFGLFCIDLDGFKGINDRLGHEAGDELLVGVTKSLRAIMHPSAVLARLGGDEFAILVPDLASSDECHDLVARIKLAVASADAGRLGLAVSASVGFALFPDDASAKAGLLGLADNRMYADKRFASTSSSKRLQPRSLQKRNHRLVRVS
jgi:diguanylate cyclase (GGDEF)-like protein